MKYKDSYVYKHKVCFHSHSASRKWVCPICEKPITDGSVYLIVNNQKYFPNCIIHEDCFENTENVFEKVEEKAKELKELKIRYEKLKTIF